MILPKNVSRNDLAGWGWKPVRVAPYRSRRRIAAELLAAPALLRLTTKRLESDIRARFGVSHATAFRAICDARMVSRGASA